MDEGYIKFKCDWKEKNINIPENIFSAISEWKTKLFQLNLIGIYENNIGFGNISYRDKTSDKFFITGSTTGGIEHLKTNHISIWKTLKNEK